MTSRRSFLLGFGAALAAPAIVRADSIMRVAALRQTLNERTATEVLLNWQQDLHARAEFAAAWEEMVSVGWSMITRVSFTDGDIRTLFIPSE